MPNLSKIMIAFGALGATLPQLTHAMPDKARPWILGAASICVVIATVLGAVTGTAIGGSDAKSS
jgi:hypothetical protein